MQARRITTTIPIDFKTGHITATGQIRNLGPGGLFISTRAIPEQGETVALRFRMPSGEPMSLLGLVWWTTEDESSSSHRGHGFGLRLIEQNESYERVVDRMLA